VRKWEGFKMWGRWEWFLKAILQRRGESDGEMIAAEKGTRTKQREARPYG